MSVVYFLKFNQKDEKSMIQAGEKIFNIFIDFFSNNDKVAIKVHFGERQSKTYLKPVFVKTIYEMMIQKVKEAALVDCNVLYKGDRSLGSSHKKLAQEQGFDFAPIIIADGEKGEEEMEIEVQGKYFEKVKLGKGINDFNSLLVISHFTGHGSTGFGGTIKNIGMGLGSKSGKLAMHKAFNLKISPAVCQGCAICQKECPGKAIFLKNGKASINHEKCLSCGRCISECPLGAIEIPWGDTSSKTLQEKIVEYAVGVLKNKKAFFVNVLIDITSGCDCQRMLQIPFLPDIGILAAENPVALDQASLDLAGQKNFTRIMVDPLVQISYAEKMGLGEKKYQLISI